MVSTGFAESSHRRGGQVADFPLGKSVARPRWLDHRFSMFLILQEIRPWLL